MFSRFLSLVTLLLLTCSAALAKPLTFCADPANLPFSTKQQSGFDNRIAQILGRELGMPVAFYWGRIYHLGYHYIILPDGTLKRGRPEHCIGAHTKGFNNYLGIVLVGDFSSRDNPDGKKGLAQPTPQQLKTLVSLCRRLRAHYHFPLSRIFRHSDLERTFCPGDRFPFQEVLDQLQ